MPVLRKRGSHQHQTAVPPLTHAARTICNCRHHVARWPAPAQGHVSCGLQLHGKAGAEHKDTVLQELGLSALNATVEVRLPDAAQVERVALSEVRLRGSPSQQRAVQAAVHAVTGKLRDKLMACNMVRALLDN